ncbi:MlaD family protein, partial [Pedococcus sp. 2YAF34]
MGDRTYGVVFLLVVGVLCSLSVAAYGHAFTRVVRVTLETDRIGSQLRTGSDVKIRGVIVGEVRSIEVTARGARLGLALKPEMVGVVPAGVSARLLPKTLFGERFVDLVTPPAGAAGAAGAGRAIRAGDVIGQDR